MRSTSAEDELISDDPFYTVVGNSIQGSYIPASSGGSGSGGTTTGSVMSVTSGGITINLVLDAAAQAAPTSFKYGLQQAVAVLAANITDKITVNINIDYSGTGGGAAAGPDSGYYENYSWVRSELVNNASAGDPTFNALPTGTAIQGQSNVAVWNAQLKLWGVIGANDTTTDDASANFATDINSNLLVGVALHELTHAMGRVPFGTAPDVFDLYRFTSPGGRLFQGGATAPAAYFSLDGGATKLADYGQNSDPSDFLNGGVQGPNDPFNEYYTSTTIQGLTAIDLKQLDALGFHLAMNSPVTIESYGSTALVQAGSNYFMNRTAGGAGPELRYSGTGVVVGQFGGYAAIAAEQTTTGYDVAWKMANVDQYTVWSTDGNGNYISNIIGAVSGNSTSFETLEVTFHQDLNGDGVIGVPTTTTIESSGATALVQVGQHYFLDPVAGGLGPELKYGGSPVTAGQFAPYALIGAEQTSTGYDVAWKSTTADLYVIWGLDSSGNYVTHLVAGSTGTGVSGSSTTLESYEAIFHQDLNGDGTIGFPAGVGTAIESAGSTTLLQVGTNYFLNPVAGGTGPELKYGGSPVTAGQFAPYTLIGAEQTSTGYDVAWKSTTADLYIIWGLDSSGNYATHLVVGSTGAGVSGSSTVLESYEAIFHQDLNGDGTIGFPAGVGTAIESAGSTALLQVGTNYFLNPVAGGTGPELKYGGSPVTAGQFAPYTPIGAEQTSTGYDVAWKSTTADLYIIWGLDSSGNYATHLVAGSAGAGVSGNSTTLESYETIFHQDLNGDGKIGIPAATTAATADNFHFATGGGSALSNFQAAPPELQSLADPGAHQPQTPAAPATDQHTAVVDPGPTLSDYLASLSHDHLVFT